MLPLRGLRGVIHNAGVVPPLVPVLPLRGIWEGHAPSRPHNDDAHVVETDKLFPMNIPARGEGLVCLTQSLLSPQRNSNHRTSCTLRIFRELYLGAIPSNDCAVKVKER